MMLLLQINLYKSRLCVCTHRLTGERERKSKNCSEIMIKCCCKCRKAAQCIQCEMCEQKKILIHPHAIHKTHLFSSSCPIRTHRAIYYFAIFFLLSPSRWEKNIITIKNGSTVAIAVIIICLRVREKKNESRKKMKCEL